MGWGYLLPFSRLKQYNDTRPFVCAEQPTSEMVTFSFLKCVRVGESFLSIVEGVFYLISPLYKGLLFGLTEHSEVLEHFSILAKRIEKNECQCIVLREQEGQLGGYLPSLRGLEGINVICHGSCFG